MGEVPPAEAGTLWKKTHSTPSAKIMWTDVLIASYFQEMKVCKCSSITYSKTSIPVACIRHDLRTEKA